MISIAKIDLNLVTHCQRQCVSCSHASPIMPKWFMTIEMVERDLAALKPFLTVEQVMCVGGETLLNPNLPAIIRAVKESGICRQVVVITNGDLLPRMKAAFWAELDWLQISIYGGFDEKILDLVELERQRYGFAVGTTRFTHFYRQLKAVPDDGVESFRTCHWRHDCRSVHNGYFYACSQSCFFPKAIMGLPAETDGLPLEGLTEDKLRAFLDRKEPFQACRVCCANEMIPEPWRETTSRKTWIQESIAS